MGYSDEYKTGGGNLNMRVELQDFTLAGDDGGGHAKVWNTVKTVWAGIKPVSSYEKLIGQQTNNEVSHKVCLRYFTTGFNTRWRIKWGDRYFAVVGSVDVDEGRRYFDLRAVERPEKFFES